MIYAVQCQVVTEYNGYRSSHGTPTFFLDSAIQGIRDVAHAGMIAKSMFKSLSVVEVYPFVVECPDAIIIRGLDS